MWVEIVFLIAAPFTSVSLNGHEDEMFDKCFSICVKSVYHYFAAYGEDAFL